MALKLYHCMVYCSTKVKKGTLLSPKTKLQKDVAAIGICLKLIKQNKADRTLHCWKGLKA